jgi:hypothetical protein
MDKIIYDITCEFNEFLIIYNVENKELTIVRKIKILIEMIKLINTSVEFHKVLRKYKNVDKIECYLSLIREIFKNELIEKYLYTQQINDILTLLNDYEIIDLINTSLEYKYIFDLNNDGKINCYDFKKFLFCK